jgi:SulP family sulfate permease
MPQRHKMTSSAFFPFRKVRLFVALRERFQEGYGFSDLRSDLMSGMVVGMVAIPLGMALAIASGVPPQHGLYTVIIGGAVIALLGGSRFQVSGPTAAFVVILAPVAQKFGLGGLLLAGLIAGVILILFGLARLGKMIQFIPYPVTTGFTSGIAVVIATLQLKDFFGLEYSNAPDHFLETVGSLFEARGTASAIEIIIGVSTLILLILWPKINKKVPSPLVALGLISVLAALFKVWFPEIEIATIGSRFSYDMGEIIGYGIPQTAPQFGLPWNFTVQDEEPIQLSFDVIKSILPSSFAIAMLAAIESLLSAVVADGMSQTKHDPDGELVALGIGNILCPFFGGIAATGAIARTATNIRFGARSPLSAIFHAFFVLVVILLLAPYVSYLPMAALAALLMVIAYNMSEAKHFLNILRVAPRSDVVVLLLCFFLTVIFDMVVGVTVGVVLASLLFMRRMAEVTDSHPLTSGSHQLISTKRIPNDIVIYEIEGPLFFGAAEKAAGALIGITDNIRGVIFLMGDVPTMDVTGLVAFESAIRRLLYDQRRICLVGLRSQPRELIEKSELAKYRDKILFSESVDEALESLCEG